MLRYASGFVNNKPLGLSATTNKPVCSRPGDYNSVVAYNPHSKFPIFEAWKYLTCALVLSGMQPAALRSIVGNTVDLSRQITRNSKVNIGYEQGSE